MLCAYFESEALGRIRTCRAKFTQRDWINGGTEKNKRGVRACRCKWVGFENIYPFICIRVAEFLFRKVWENFMFFIKSSSFRFQDADLPSNSSSLLKAFTCDLITEIFSRRDQSHIKKLILKVSSILNLALVNIIVIQTCI